MKTISVRIVLFTVMCLVPFCSFSAVDDDMYDSELRMDDVFHDEARTYYHIIKDNEVEVVRCEAKNTVIPNMVYCKETNRNYQVTRIAYTPRVERFDDLEYHGQFGLDVQSITIPASVTDIDYGPFAPHDNYYENMSFYPCSYYQLKNIYVAKDNPMFYDIDGVLYKKPGELFFVPCNKTKAGGSYTIDPSTQSLAPYAFCMSKISYLTIPEGEIATIPSYFIYENIGRGSFRRISIPRSVTLIQKDAFRLCYMASSGYGCEIVVDGSEKGIVIEDASLDCAESVTLGEGVNRVDDYMEFVSEISLPSTLTYLAFVESDESRPHGRQSLNACRRLAVSEDNPVYKSVDNVLFSKDGKTLLRYCGKREGREYEVPEGTVEIAAYAFFVARIEKLYIPSSVTIVKECGIIPYDDYMAPLNTIVCEATIPPTFLTEEIDDIYDYDSYKVSERLPRLTLYVPDESVDAYKSDDIWGKMQVKRMSEMTSSISVGIDSDTQQEKLFNLSGQRISVPSKGMNIVVYPDGTTVKTFNVE